MNLCVNDLFKIKKISSKNDFFSIFEYNNQGELRKRVINGDEKIKIEQINEIKENTSNLLTKCRHLVGTFKHSEPLTRRFKEKQTQLDSESKTYLVQDVPTRWNSTLDMLSSILVNRDVLFSMSFETVNNIIKTHLPKDFELLIIGEIIKLLEPLKELTQLFSVKKFVSNYILYPSIYSLVNHILPDLYLTLSDIKILREELILSLNTRFSYVLNDHFFLAGTFLHYQFKNFEFIKNFDERIKYKNEAIEYIENLFNNSELFKDLRENYKQADTQSNESSTVIINSSSDKNTESHKSFFSNLCDQQRQNNRNELNQLQNEIQNYIRSSFTVIPKKNESIYGPLIFFRYNKENFPILTYVTKAIFCVPATSVPSESLFSLAGLIQDDLRNRINPVLLEILTFIKHNSSQKEGVFFSYVK